MYVCKPLLLMVLFILIEGYCWHARWETFGAIKEKCTPKTHLSISFSVDPNGLVFLCTSSSLLVFPPSALEEEKKNEIKLACSANYKAVSLSRRSIIYKTCKHFWKSVYFQPLLGMNKSDTLVHWIYT